MSNVKDKPHLLAVARRLAVARLEAGHKTRTAGAKALGVLPVTYRAWENAQNGVPTEYLGHICATFGVSMDWLMTGRPTNDARADRASRKEPDAPVSRKMGALEAIEMALDAEGLSIRQADDQHGSVGIFVPPDHIPMFIAHLNALVAQRGLDDA